MSRVLLLLTAPAWRGSGVSFGKIGRALQDAGHAVTAVVACDPVRRGLVGFGMHNVLSLDLPDSSRRSINALIELREKESGWDLVIADSPRDVRLASSARLGPIAWRFNLPNRPVPSDLWSRWLFRRVRLMVYQSRFVESMVAEKAPWLARRGGVTILNGYDVERLQPDPARGLAWRSANGIPANAPLLVTAGALSPEKALPVTLEAGTILSREFPGLQQVLIGTGEDATRLRETVAPQVILLGELSPNETHDAFRAADVVVQLSPRETFSNVVAEAMALGAAVVGANTGGIHEVLGSAGISVPSQDVVAVTDAIRDLLKNPERKRALGVAARERIVREYPLEKMARGYVALLEP